MAKNFLDYAGLAHLVSKIKTALTGKADLKNGVHIVTTEGDGAAYTATVPGITELTAGINFIMIPHVVSSTTQPTLNVNGLGAKNLRQPLTNNTAATATAALATWLSAGKPVWVKYDGTQWKTDIPRPSASSLYGTVPIDGGGTGASVRATAYVNLMGGGTWSGAIDDFKDTGVYWVRLADCTGSIPPFANSSYGFLEIIKAADGSSCIQRFYGYTSNVYWSRTYVNSAWQPWRCSYSLTSDQYGESLPTAGNAGRVFFKKVSS